MRPWNKIEKDQFPSPLAAVFKKNNTTLAFVGDRHADPQSTYKLVEATISKTSPQIIVVEGLAYAHGENPKKHLNLYVGKTKEQVWTDPSLGCGTELIAMSRNIPIIGGEPTIEEQMSSPYLLSKGYTQEDILNVQILQRIPYRRDKLKISDTSLFFEYAIKLYRINETNFEFQKEFMTWYKNKTQKDFEYSKITKTESAVNCAPTDTYIQKVACDFNINRDRFLVEKINELIKKYKNLLVVYGTGHFVQEYPSFIKGFGNKPEYIE